MSDDRSRAIEEAARALLTELDRIAREFGFNYGLPIYCPDPMAGMVAAVVAALAKQAGGSIGE